jgi:hypothetical protein
MFVRVAFLILAVLMVQLVPTKTSAQDTQKSSTDGAKKKGPPPRQYTDECGTKEMPAPYRTPCGQPKKLHMCNGKNTICCTIGDKECLLGKP